VKRKPVFIGEEEKVIHGQIVKVSVFGEVDPDPTLDFDRLLADICGASPERLAAIKAEVERYKERRMAAEFPEFSDIEFICDDEFLDTAAENALAALEEYFDETEEKFLPLDEQLSELGID